ASSSSPAPGCAAGLSRSLAKETCGGEAGWTSEHASPPVGASLRFDLNLALDPSQQGAGVTAHVSKVAGRDGIRAAHFTEPASYIGDKLTHLGRGGVCRTERDSGFVKVVAHAREHTSAELEGPHFPTSTFRPFPFWIVVSTLSSASS